MKQEARTAALIGVTIAGLLVVSAVVVLRYSEPPPEDETTPAILLSPEAFAEQTVLGLPGQFESQQREAASLRWAEELDQALPITPEYRLELEFGDPSVDDVLRPMGTALEELKRQTR